MAHGIPATFLRMMARIPVKYAALNPRSRLGCLRARCVPGTLNSETRIHTEALTCTTGNM